MSFSLRGAISGAAGVIGQQQGLRISAATQALRDEQMAKFQMDRQVQQQGFMEDQQTQNLNAQGYLANEKSKAKVESDRLAREQKLADLSDTRAYDEKRFKEETDIKQANALKLGAADPKVAAKDIRADKFQEKLAGADAVLFDETRKGSMAVAGIEDGLSVLEGIMDDYATGATPDLMAVVGAYLGTEAGAARQLWIGTVAPMLLEKAESMTGVLSDKDMQFLIASLPSFGSSESANREMIRLMRSGMDRLMENNASMEAHIKKYNSLTDWSAPNQQGSIKVDNEMDETSSPSNTPLGTSDSGQFQGSFSDFSNRY
jgi:hypothetical protein